jgi:hypothetical protein
MFRIFSFHSHPPIPVLVTNALDDESSVKGVEKKAAMLPHTKTAARRTGRR